MGEIEAINAEDGIASILSTLNSTIVDSMCRTHIDYKLKALIIVTGKQIGRAHV